jgi:hypothetical protein
MHQEKSGNLEVKLESVLPQYFSIAAVVKS